MFCKRLLVVFLFSSVTIFAQLNDVCQTYSYGFIDSLEAFNNKIHYNNGDMFIAPYRGGLAKITNTGTSLEYTKQHFFENNLVQVKKPTIYYSIHGGPLFFLEDGKTASLNKNVKNLLKVGNDSILLTTHDSVFLYQLQQKKLSLIASHKDTFYNFHTNSNGKKFLLREKKPLKDPVEIIEIKNNTFDFKNSIIIKRPKELVRFIDVSKYSITYRGFSGNIHCANANSAISSILGNSTITYFDWALKPKNNKNIIYNVVTKKKHTFNSVDRIHNFVVDTEQKNGYFGTTNKAIRTFFYLSKVPNVFNSSNSSACFTLNSNKKGEIIAGSYNKYLSVIKDTIVTRFNPKSMVMPGAIFTNNHFYFIGEDNSISKSGIHKILDDKKIVEIKGTKKSTGFLLFVSSKDNLYYATAGKGLWEITKNNLLLNNGKWNKIDTLQKENKLVGNILTINEDIKQRIWFAGNRGLGIYTPKSKKTTYLLRGDKKATFGVMSSVKDNHNFLWFGGYEGLFYYDNTDTLQVKKVKHPLLQKGNIITSMYMYKNQLILLATDKVLVLDLDAFHQKKEVNIKYLTDIETSFSGSTEQNCIAKDAKSNIWFATSNMIYKWDFDTWLSIPKRSVIPEVQIKLGESKSLDAKNRCFELEPLENNFKAVISYYDKDRLPRFLRTNFYKENKNEKIFTKISTNNKFEYSNLSSGKYYLELELFQLDGTIYKTRYQIYIKEFWYKRWWFWVIFGVIGLSLIVSFYQKEHQKQKAQQELVATKLTFEKEKQEMLKEMSSYQLIALSNQFRPHFLLNTINTIGAHLVGQPKATKLLDLLGKSIGSLFQMTKENKNHHPFKDEWSLVENLIDIYKLIYLEELHVNLPVEEELKKLQKCSIPFGLLQINVENALLHGLHNKVNPPYTLSIELKEDEVFYVFCITDDGVGRKKANSLSNKRKHGTGLKNLNKTLNLYNQYQKDKISINFIDDIFSDNGSTFYGTRVEIKLPKDFNYEIFQNKL